MSHRRLIRQFSLLLILTLCQCSLLALAAKPPAKNLQVLKIKQNDCVFGDRTIYIGDRSFRLEWPMAELVVMSSNPYEEFVLYNPKTKRGTRANYTRLTQNLNTLQFGLTADIFDVPFKKIGPTSIAGLNCDLYIGAFDGDQHPELSPKQGKSYCQYSIYSVPAMNHNALEILSDYASMPNLGGVPMKAEFFCLAKEFNYLGMQRSGFDNDVRRSRMYLKTLASERVAVAPSIFEPPQLVFWKAPLHELMGGAFEQRGGGTNAMHAPEVPEVFFQSKFNKKKQQQ